MRWAFRLASARTSFQNGSSAEPEKIHLRGLCLYQALSGFHAVGRRLVGDFITSESLHNQRHGRRLLCGARTSADGYREGSGWRAPCRTACRAAYIPSAPRLPQYAADEKKPKGIAQSQSTSWDSQSQESEHHGWDK